MKYSRDEYSISEKYAEKIRKRMSMFQKKTRTKKALRCTFITTYGVNGNKHSDIVDNQIRIDELFH